MSDSRVSVRVPFVSVRDAMGRELAHSYYAGDATVVMFKYKYDDEDDDTCTVKLQMSDPLALDKLGIERGAGLQLIWGYLNGETTIPIKVVVRDMTSKYGNEVIYTELECTDYLSFLKIVRSEDSGEGTFLSFIQSQVYGKHNIIIQEGDRIIYRQLIKEKPRGDEPPETRYGDFPGTVGPRPYTTPLEELITYYKGVVWGDQAQELRLRMVEIGEWMVPADHKVREYLEKETGIPTSGRSTFVVMQDMFRKAPMGPWFVTGRGDTLFIHNRNLIQGVYKGYSYYNEPGELIDFVAKTKYDNFDKQLISYAGVDPTDRSTLFVDDYRKELFNTQNPKEILEDRRLTPEEKHKKLMAWANLRNIPYATWGIQREHGALFNNEDGWHFVKGNFDNPRISEPVVRDADEIPYDAMTREGPTTPFDKFYHNRFLRAYWYTMPLLTRQEAIDTLNNRQRELAMDKEEGDMIVIGDPFLQSEMKIRISNVSKANQGDYYIKKCEHILAQEGYKTTITSFKVTPDSMINTFSRLTKDEYDASDDVTKELFDKIFEREQFLFNSDLVVSYWSKSKAPWATDEMKKAHDTYLVPVQRTFSYQGLLEEGHTRDEAISRLIEIYKQNPGANIEFKANNK